MSDTNGNSLPPAREAVIDQAHRLHQEVAHERDLLRLKVGDLMTEIAGLEAQLQIAELTASQLQISDGQHICLSRDEAVARRAECEAVLRSIMSIGRAFRIDNEPLIRETTEDEAYAENLAREDASGVSSLYSTPSMSDGDGNEAEAAACLSREAARKAYPRTYLYWHKRSVLVLRCWSATRKGEAYREWSRHSCDSSSKHRQEALLMIPPEIVPSLPKPEAPPPIRWDWEPMARYTTFEGEEPDVWPTLEDNERHFGWMAGFMAAILTYLLWRRHERRKINVQN